MDVTSKNNQVSSLDEQTNNQTVRTAVPTVICLNHRLSLPPRHPPLSRSSSPQVTSDPAGDTLIPLPLQGKDNHLLQQLLPSLLNPAVLGGSLPAGHVHRVQGHLD